MLTITPAANSDTDEIIALRHAAEDWLTARGITQWTPREVPGSVIHRQVEAGEFFAARYGDQPTIIGACRLIWSDPDIWADRDRFAGYLHTLVIARDHAGIDLGRSLLEWVAVTARQAGADLLRLDCVESNSALCDYYLRAGFSQVGHRDLGSGLHSVTLFERPLSDERFANSD